MRGKYPPRLQSRLGLFVLSDAHSQMNSFSSLFRFFPKCSFSSVDLRKIESVGQKWENRHSTNREIVFIGALLGDVRSLFFLFLSFMIILIAVISIAQYLTDSGKHTMLYKTSKLSSKLQKQTSDIVFIVHRECGGGGGEGGGGERFVLRDFWFHFTFYCSWMILAHP